MKDSLRLRHDDSYERKLDGARVMVTGATGFLGKHVVADLEAAGVVVLPVSRSLGIDLRSEDQTDRVILRLRPDAVIHLAATCGGIGANMARPGTFFRDNMLMGMNVVHAAAAAGTRLISVGTICSYPKHCPIPFSEEDFWDGYPEPTNAPYGIAKKALFVMMRAYREQFGLSYAYLVPVNLYGPNDHFEDSVSHVVPAMIKRFIEAREKSLSQVSCWGTGQATRSFLFVKDASKAIVRACARLDYDDIVNVSGTEETSMADLAETIAHLVDYRGQITWDRSKPDGQPRRMVDGARAKALLNWVPETSLEEGLRSTVGWYSSQRKHLQS